MKENLTQTKRRTATIIQKLQHQYPNAHCALHHRNALELVVATILSAQCTDERVNKVTPALFARYKTAQDYAKAPLSDLQEIIKTTGFFRAKAKSLKGLGEKLAREFAGQVPNELSALMSLPGVGRKTANVVLGEAFGISVGIVVDTHVKRLAYRLGLTRAKEPVRVELDLQKVIPREHWILIAHWLISHGRQICKARSPQCVSCPLAPNCPKRGVTLMR
jgi:endonuclease-3